MDRSLAFIYGLLLLSIMIATFGIVITLLLAVYERRRETGLLRAVGMTRAQVRTTVRWESVITSLYGAFVGVLGGLSLVMYSATTGISCLWLNVVGAVGVFITGMIVSELTRSGNRELGTGSRK